MRFRLLRHLLSHWCWPKGRWISVTAGALWLLGWLVVGPAAAQSLATTPWVADSVLSALVVRTLAPDDQGYLWVGTTEGLRRYDGYQAVPLAKLVAASKVAPPRGYINALIRDDAGRLWLGGPEGLYCLVPATGVLTRIELPIGPTDDAAVVSALWQDPRTRRLWVGYCAGRVLALNPDQPDGLAQPLPPALLEQPIQFAAARSGAVWLTTLNGQLHLLDSRGRRQRVYTRPGAYLLPVPGTVPQLVVSSHALYELDPRGGTVRERQRWLPAEPGEQAPFQPTLDSAGRPAQWLAQRQRLVVQWGARGTRPVVRHQAVAFEGTEPSTQYTLFQDARQLWWGFTPAARGCYKGGTPVPVQPLMVAGLVRPPSVRGLARLPDGQLLVTSYSGIFLQPAGQPQASLRPLALTRAGEPWPAILYSVRVSAAGRVLFADEADTFGELDVRTGALTYYSPAEPAGTNPMRVHGRALCQSRTGAVWGGGTTGLYRIDEARQRVVPYRDPAGHEPLRGREVRSINEDAAGTLWLATNDGLYALNPATGALRHYGPAEPAPNRRLPAADLLCVYAAPTGGVWVGSSTHGLLRLDARRGLVAAVGPAQGLPSPTVVTLLPGAPGELWAGTYAGLVCYRPATGQLSVYGPAEGLANPELNKQAAYRTADGTLFFGGVGGVFRVQPGAAPAGGDRPPRLLLTAHAGGLGLVRPLLASGPVPTLALGRTTTEVGVNLALDDYRAPALNRFFYQLHEATAEADSAAPVQQTGPHLRLHGLAPGTYELRVWGQTPVGQRTPPRYLRLAVARPWWQHPLALLAAVGLLLGASFGVQQVRIRRLQREARLRTRIAADLHDEVGALLTRVSLRAELLQEPAAPEEVTAEVQALVLDSRAALTMMRDVVWSIDAGADTVGALRDRLHDHLDATAQAAHLRATLTVSGLPDATPLALHLRQHLYLIAKEAITNAVRHARGATHVQLELRRQGPALELCVQDDGQAPAAPQPASAGMGLHNMLRRAEALGGQLAAGPAASGGWCVRVRVPYPR